MPGRGGRRGKARPLSQLTTRKRAGASKPRCCVDSPPPKAARQAPRQAPTPTPAVVSLPQQDQRQVTEFVDGTMSQTAHQSRVNLQAHVHLHSHHHEDRRVINQGNIGHLSTGDDNRRDTTLTSANRELVNQLEKNTLARITSWTAGMVKTAALHSLLSMIKSGSRWVTVRGSPGEGKTTLGYQALLELSSAGSRVFQVWKPEELSCLVSECPQSSVVMLDDMFGQLSFDLDNWRKWEVELHKVLGETEHHSHKQPQTPKKDVVVIVVGRDYVFNSAKCNFGKYSKFFTGAKHVINMTLSYERDVQEKMSIWKTLSEAGGVELEKKTVEKICKIRCPHGFPHICKLFITMLQEDKNLKAGEFFKSPLLFLNQTVARFMENDDVFEVFKELIVVDGKVSVKQLGQLPRSRQIIKAADNLVGSYLKKENFVFEFDHPSIFDSVAYHFSNSHLDVVIQKCPMSFLHERIRLKPLSDHDIPSSENSFTVYIPRSYSSDLAQRFATEVSKRNISKVLSHQAMRDLEFVKEFMSALNDPLQFRYKTDVNYILLRDSVCSAAGTFLYYISSSQSPLLLKYIETQLSTYDIESVMMGACRFAAADVVTYLMKRHNIDINMQPGGTKQTPLMMAAESGDSGVVNTILDMKPDVSVRDDLGLTALHYLCYNGVASAVSRVIDMGCGVNGNGYGMSPLSWACTCNQTAVVRVLLDRGASIDSEAVAAACKGGNEYFVNTVFDRGASDEAVAAACEDRDLDVATLLFDRGASVDSKAVAAACEGGNLDIVKLLFDKGASVDMETCFYGSLLNTACIGRSLRVVEYLIEKGASVNKASRFGTPLHAACSIDWYQGVQLLLEHGADINSRDEAGLTPLHDAARSWPYKCLEMLLSAGANVNIQDEDGSTPLHKAAGSESHKSVVMLTKAGADTRIVSKDGRTPLHSAVGGRFDGYLLPGINMCHTLITHGVDVNSVDREANTVLHMLCEVESDTEIDLLGIPQPASSFSGQYRSLVKMLVEKGADKQKWNNDGEPALHGWCRQLFYSDEN